MKQDRPRQQLPKRRGDPGWVGFIVLVPLAGVLVLLGVLLARMTILRP